MSPEGALTLELVLWLLYLVMMILRSWFLWRDTVSSNSVAKWIIYVVPFYSLANATCDIAVGIWSYVIDKRYGDAPDVIPGVGLPLGPGETDLRLIYMLSVTSVVSMWGCKAVLLAYYFNVQKRVQLFVRVYLWFTALFCAATFVVVFGIHLGWCRPIDTNWIINDKLCATYHSPAVIAIYTVMSIVTDLMIMIVPLAIFRQLQMSSRTVSGIMFITFVGVLSIAASAGRLIEVYKLSRQLEPGTGFVGATRTGHIVLLMGELETYCAGYAAVLPSMRVVFRRLFPSFSSDAQASSTAARSNFIKRSGYSKGSKQSTSASKTDVDNESLVELRATSLSGRGARSDYV